METYSLIQSSLDTVIDRQSLEEASVAAPSVGKADCARIARELFGIVVSGIPIEDAIAFRAALMAKGLPTLIAADSDIPRLPQGRFFNRIDANDEAFILADALGRREIFRAEEVLLLAAGFLRHMRGAREEKIVEVKGAKGETRYVSEFQSTVADTPEFRFECFIKRNPYRLCLMLDANTNFIWNGIALRLEKPDPIHAFLKTWHRYVPEDKWNLGLQRNGTDFQYPSLRAFENEIRWRFYQLK